MKIKFFSQILFIFSFTIISFEIQSLGIKNFSLLADKTSTYGCCKKLIKRHESNGFSSVTKDHQGLKDAKELQI
jgi:hypothetical protein